MASFEAQAQAYGPDAAPIEADYTEDEAIGISATSSLLTSIESDLKAGHEENGRIYATYGKNEYYMPVDDEELDRHDMNHQKYTALLGDQLFLCPLKEPQQILDLGTGTGVWCIDIADQFPAAQVTGTDIAPIQPQWIPPNCTFQIDDAEAEWTFEKNYYDLVHARDLYQSIRDWPRLVQQCFQHTKPGGYTELQCVFPTPTSDDNTLPYDCAYMEIARTFQDIGAKIASEPAAPTKFKTWMEEVGFEDVTQTVLRIPCSPWPRDPRLKKIGALELINVVEGARAFCLRGFTRDFGRTVEELEELVSRMRKELCSNKFHAYVFYYVVHGRRPAGPQKTGGIPTADGATNISGA